MGEVLLLAAVVSSVGSSVLVLPRIRVSVPRVNDVSKSLILVTFLSLTLAFGLLVSASISSDFSYRYVCEHSSSDLQTVYKISAVWAGGAGSLLMCVWLMSLTLAASLAFLGRRREISQLFKDGYVSSLSLLIAFFASATLMAGAFERTSELQLVTYPEGMGLDVMLQTPEMTAHAPLIFGAYAALSAVFAASVSYRLSGERLWFVVSLPLGRVAWLLLTAGIGLGAVWAYNVIGWGGYWSWDPVETSSLVPWFMITAFLHTQLRLVKGGEYSIASPAFGMLSFIGVVFVSFVVRAGGLWSSSVHDYGASTVPSATSRLITLLQHEASLAALLGFLVILLLVTFALSLQFRPMTTVRSPQRVRRRLEEYVNDQNAMLVAIVLMAMSALVAVLLMLKNIESTQSVTYEELDQKMTVFFVAIAVILGLCLVWRIIGRRRALLVSSGLVALSIVLALIGVMSTTLNGLVLFVLPSSLFAIVLSVVRLLKSLSIGPLGKRLHCAAAHVIHLGIAMIILGNVAASNLQSYPEEGGDAFVPLNGQILVADYVIGLTAITDFRNATGYPAGVDLFRTAKVDIYRGGDLVAEDAELLILYSYDPTLGPIVVERVAFVESSVLEDLYISFEWVSDGGVVLHARLIPMIKVLWTGVILLVAGLSMRLLTSGLGGPVREPD